MVEPVRACVTDTNVWIDLHVAQIVEVAVTLPIVWHAPDIVLAELRQGLTGEALISLGVRSIELSATQLAELTRLADVYRRPSVVDLSALVIARSLGATLLTGDHHLREAAEQEGIPIHGTLWLLDRLLEHRVMGPTALAAALDQMLTAGRRLPRDQAEARLTRWGGRV